MKKGGIHKPYLALVAALFVFVLVPGTSAAQTITYQRGDGKGSVSETDDAELRAGSPNGNFSTATTLNIDGNPHQHVILKFPNIFGSGPNQIPPDSTINSATLTLRVFDFTNNDPTVYQITESWVESQVTWNSRSTGLPWTNPGADGTGSHKPTAEGDFPMNATGFQSMDVTTSVQNWSNGEANEGWVLVDNSNNNAAFDSSENATVANRPQLTVDYTSPPLRLSSATDQSFTVGDPPTVAATITITDASIAPTITAANGIRIRIPASFNMTWDASVTTVTIGGTAASKVSTTLLPYEDGGKTVVLDVSSDFAAGDQITIDGLRFTSFTAPSAADNLELEVNNDDVVSATDDKTIAVNLATLLAYYAMDESSWSGAGTVIDGSGNGNNGDPVGNANTVLNGQVCGGGETINDGDAVNTNVDVNSVIGGRGTITFWFRPNWTQSGSERNQARVIFDASIGDKYFKLIKADNRNNVYPDNGARRRLALLFKDSSDNDFVAFTSSEVSFSNGTWTHIAVTWDYPGDRFQIYVDGVLRANQSINTDGNIPDLDTLYLGDNRSGYNPYGVTTQADGTFDEVRIYSEVRSQADVTADLNAIHACIFVRHYRIDHVGASGGVAVTCEAEAVTIIAHDLAHTPVVAGPTTTITVSTSPLGDTWALKAGTGTFVNLGGGQAEYTFGAAEAQVELWLTKTTAATIDIDVVDNNSNIEDPTEDPSLEFRDTAFRFYADGVANTIGTQISRKENNIAPGVQAMTLRAVRTSTDTGACEARLTGAQVVDMAFECDNPNTCVAGQEVVVTGTAAAPIPGNPDGGVTAYAPVDLLFDATGTAPFTFNYTDAGRIALHARKALAANPPDPAITLTGASNDFVVRPAGLCVESTDANSDCAAGDNSCSAFVKAGTSAFADSSFNLTISAVGWEVAGEADTDFCSGNIVTPNFQLNTMALTHAKIAPMSGGVAGSLGVSSFDMVAADSGQHTVTNQAISEVGVFTITAAPPAYLGQPIAVSTSDNIGRFYPDRFDVTPNVPTFAHSCVAGTFTYTDETFYYGTPPQLTVQAVNTAGVDTVNYSGPAAPDPDRFWMLATLLPGRNYMDQAGAAATFNLPTLGGTVTLTNEQDFDGNGDLTMDAGMAGDDFLYQRVTPEAPFSALVDMNIPAADLTDGDGACYDPTNDGTCDDFDISGIGGTQMRFGRLVILNAFGGEVLPLPVPMRTEYFVNAATGFATNVADTCTTLSEDYLDLVNDIDDPPLGANPATINIGVGTSTGTIGNSPMVAGDAGQSFNAPGADNTGYVDIEANLTAPAMAQPPLPWLMYDWDGIDQGGDGDIYDDHPTGRGSFGVYSGSGRHIYLRELY